MLKGGFVGFGFFVLRLPILGRFFDSFNIHALEAFDLRVRLSKLSFQRFCRVLFRLNVAAGAILKK